MATNTPGDRPKVPDQEQYEDQTLDRHWTELEDGDGHFHVREVPPLKLLRDMDRYGVQAMLGGGGDDDEVNMAEIMEQGDFSGFVENVVIPNIIEPDCYWSDVAEVGGDWDLAALTSKDFLQVIAGMTGRDPEELAEEADDQFPG